MPLFEKHQSLSVVKLLLVGDSGGGKTGALASLANAGYNLRVLDFDNGLDILGSYLTSEGAKRVSFHTLRDKIKSTPQGPMFDGPPDAFSRAMKILNGWDDLGPAMSWGPDSILVLDSMTFFGDAAFHYVCALNGKLGPAGSATGPRIQDYGLAMDKVEDFISLITSDTLRCHVIVNTHITYVEVPGPGGSILKAYPMCLGKKLPPKIPRYFNTVVRTKTLSGGTRIITTVSDAMLDLKTTAPTEIPSELPLADGLCTIFKILRERGNTFSKATT